MTNDSIKSLIVDLSCDDILKCQNARRSLVALGHEAVPSLVESLGSKKHWVRWEAAKALAQIADPSAAQALVDALRDKEFDVRWLAAEGLIKIGHRVLRPLLMALIEHSDSIWLRQGAHHVLHDMDKGNIGEIIRLLLPALSDTEPSEFIPVLAKKTFDTLSAEDI
jgi:HEAT repeat protein